MAGAVRTASANWPPLAGAAAAALLALVIIIALASDPGRVPPEPAGRDNSPAAIHRRILVLDGWLGSVPLPCGGAGQDHLAKWERGRVDSGIWWVKTQDDLAAAQCWIRKQDGAITLATRAGDAPRLHTAGKRSLYLGVIDPRTEDLAELYAAGVRFARAPDRATQRWMHEARRLGFVVDVASLSGPQLAALLSRYGPPLLFSQARGVDPRPDPAMIRKLGLERGGVMLMRPAAGGTGIADMRECLQYLMWPHCAIGGATDPQGLSIALLDDGLTEGNLSRMFGYDLLRLLRRAEIWAGKR